jgi:putative endonuclease
MPRVYFVYIVASWSRCLYTGYSGNLVQRAGQHKGLVPRHPGFTSRYRAHRLVWFEAAPSAYAARAREKQIKRWRRARKVALITAFNPEWRDLAAKWPEIECPE